MEILISSFGQWNTCTNLPIETQSALLNYLATKSRIGLLLISLRFQNNYQSSSSMV